MLIIRFTMTSYDFTSPDMDERAFTIFLIEGIYFFLDQGQPLHHGSIIDYSNRLWSRWIQMSREEKMPFYDRARDELCRVRRNDIYRSAFTEN